MEGRLTIDPSGRSCEIRDPETDEVLAEGFLVVHPGQQLVSRLSEGVALSSALQFSGALTPAGEAKAGAQVPPAVSS